MICYGKNRDWLAAAKEEGAKIVGFPDQKIVSARAGELASIATGGLAVCTAVGVVFEDDGGREAYLQHYLPSLADEGMHRLVKYLAPRTQKLLACDAVRMVIVAPEVEMLSTTRDKLLKNAGRVSAWPELRKVSQRYLGRLFEPEVVPYPSEEGNGTTFIIHLLESDPSRFVLNGQEIPEASLVGRRSALSGRL
jgi:hypothetical protein